MAHLVILSREARTTWLTEHNVAERLRRAGHSAAKAMEILLDFKRGDRYAIAWTLSAIAHH